MIALAFSLALAALTVWVTGRPQQVATSRQTPSPARPSPQGADAPQAGRAASPNGHSLFGCICDGDGTVEYSAGHDADGWLLVEERPCPGCSPEPFVATGYGTPFEPLSGSDTDAREGVPTPRVDGGAASARTPRETRPSGPARRTPNPEKNAARALEPPRAA